MKCCICSEEIEGKYGHNAEPIVADGRCCDVCNSLKVIPERLRRTNTLFCHKVALTKQQAEDLMNEYRVVRKTTTGPTIDQLAVFGKLVLRVLMNDHMSTRIAEAERGNTALIGELGVELALSNVHSNIRTIGVEMELIKQPTEPLDSWNEERNL
jgi:hypothetical protein